MEQAAVALVSALIAWAIRTKVEACLRLNLWSKLLLIYRMPLNRKLTQKSCWLTRSLSRTKTTLRWLWESKVVTIETSGRSSSRLCLTGNRCLTFTILTKTVIAPWNTSLTLSLTPRLASCINSEPSSLWVIMFCKIACTSIFCFIIWSRIDLCCMDLHLIARLYSLEILSKRVWLRDSAIRKKISPWWLLNFKTSLNFNKDKMSNFLLIS